MPAFDLGALVVQVRAGRETSVQNHMGRAIHRQFFVAIQDPLDGEQRVHPPEGESTDRLMPYAASGLMRAGSTAALNGRITEGTPAWFRLCGLSAVICDRLDQFRLNPPDYIDIDRVPWAVESIAWESEPWGAVSTHQTLMGVAQLHPQPPTHLHFEFASPTTFRSDGINLPAPLPHLVFNSLAKRWAEMTGAPVRDETLWNGFTRYHIMLHSHTTRTETVRVKDGGKEIGFVGTAVYEFTRKNEALARHDPALQAAVQADYPNLCRLASMLADYALFAGVGRKTTTGMGMARKTG